MRFTVFGGGGFIGSTICDRLLQAGHTLRIVELPSVNPYRSFSGSESVEWCAIDLTSAAGVSDAVKGADIVLHLASTTRPQSSNDDPVFDVQSNVISSLRILEAMVVHKVPKILFISSAGTVYGNPLYLPVDEKHPTNPVVSYGITKLTIEKYLNAFSRLHGIRAITLRVSNCYGERQHIDTACSAIEVFLREAIRGLPIEIWGDGSMIRDYIHVSDVAEAFVRAASYEGQETCFNISSGQGLSLNQLVEMLKDVLGTDVPVKYLAKRPFDLPVSVVDHQLASMELDWSPTITMRDGLLRVANWMKREIGCVV